MQGLAALRCAGETSPIALEVQLAWNASIAPTVEVRGVPVRTIVDTEMLSGHVHFRDSWRIRGHRTFGVLSVWPKENSNRWNV